MRVQRPTGMRQYRFSGESPRVCCGLHMGYYAKHKAVAKKGGLEPNCKGLCTSGHQRMLWSDLNLRMMQAKSTSGLNQFPLSNPPEAT